MRLAFILICAALSACAERSASRCDLEARHEIAFGNSDAVDVVSARAIGPSCDKAIGLYVVRDSEGYPLWSWSAPLKHAFGDVFEAEDTEYVQAFLEQWAAPSLSTTQSAPAWEALTPGQTTLDQLTYNDVRARDLPMLCHFSGTGVETCVFWEPAAGGAGHLLDRTVEESTDEET